MANLSKSIEVIFGGKNEISKTTSEIEQSFGKLEKLASEVSDPLANIASSIVKTDAALLSMAVGGLAYAVKTAGDFGGQFAFVTTLISETGAGVDKFKEDVKAYAVDSSASLESINKSLYNAISGGVEWKKSLEFVGAAEKLSIAGKADMAETTKILISTLNAYGSGVEKATDFSDIFFKTAQYGQMTLQDLTAPLSQITGLAASLGIPFDKLGAAIAALTSMGMPASQAITGLKAALTNIIKPSGDAEKAAASMGIQFNAAAVSTKGLEKFLWDTYAAAGGNIEKLGALFGSVEGLNSVLMLGQDTVGKYKGALQALDQRAGSTAEGYKKMAGEFDAVNQRLKNSMTVTLVEIGQKLLPEYGKIAGSLGDLMKGIKVGIDSGAFDPFFQYLDSVGASIAKWLNDVSKAFPDVLKNVDFNGLIAALQDIGKAFADLTGSTSSNALAADIKLVVDSIESLIRVTKGMGEIFAPIINSVLAAVNAFNSLDAATKESAGNILGLGAAYKMFGPLSLVMIAFGSDAESAAKFFGGFVLAVDNGVNLIKVALLGMALGFSKATEAMAQLLDYVPGYDSTAGIKRTAEASKQLSIELDLAQKQLFDSTDKLLAHMDGTATAAGNTAKKVKEIGAEAKAIAGEQMLSIVAKLDPQSTAETQWKIAEAFFRGDVRTVKMLVELANEEVAQAKAKLKAAFPDEKAIGIKVIADGTSIETTKNMIIKKFPDGTVYMTNIGTQADEARLSATQKRIEEVIPREKLLDIQATIDVAKIKSSGEIVQKAIEWKAKLDIADVEANAKIIEAVAKGISETFIDTGKVLTSELGIFADLVGSQKGGTSFIEEQIRQENMRRDATLEKQLKLTEAEIDNMKARTENLKKGGSSMITINGAGLQPHLEAFMFEILKAIQVRANAEGQKLLVGI